MKKCKRNINSPHLLRKGIYAAPREIHTCFHLHKPCLYMCLYKWLVIPPWSPPISFQGPKADLLRDNICQLHIHHIETVKIEVERYTKLLNTGSTMLSFKVCLVFSEFANHVSHNMIYEVSLHLPHPQPVFPTQIVRNLLFVQTFP